RRRRLCPRQRCDRPGGRAPTGGCAPRWCRSAAPCAIRAVVPAMTAAIALGAALLPEAAAPATGGPGARYNVGPKTVSGDPRRAGPRVRGRMSGAAVPDMLPVLFPIGALLAGIALLLLGSGLLN